MRKTKFWAVPFMALAAFCLMLLTACGGPSAEETIRENLTAEFDAVSASDSAFMASVEESADGSFDQLGIEPEEFAETYLDGFSYKIGEIKVNEDDGTATAEVTVSAKSMTTILTDFYTEFESRITSADPSTLTSEDDVYKLGGEVMMDVTRATEPEETECVFTYTLDKDGTWVIDDSAEDEIMRALM